MKARRGVDIPHRKSRGLFRWKYLSFPCCRLYEKELNKTNWLSCPSILVPSGVLALILYLFRTPVLECENSEYPSPSPIPICRLIQPVHSADTLRRHANVQDKYGLKMLSPPPRKMGTEVEQVISRLH